MRLSEEQYELIEAYLNNELSAADRTSFENELQADSELMAEVTLQRDLRLGFRAIGISQALDKARAQYNANRRVEAVPADPSSKPMPVTRPLSTWQYWAAAASVVVVLGVGYFVFQQTTEQPTDLAYNETFVPVDELTKEFPRGLAPNTRQQFLDILKEYEAGNYSTAIDQLKTLPADRQTVHYRNFFLGLSYLANKQPTEAIPLLQKALATPSVALRQKAEWFLALAYVKNGQKEKALPTLKRISADKAHPFNLLAQRVLQKIN
ncbi:hypothetical protein BN8_03293 [Fibrisoma limi BUZ 3]|uniref:Tetratricopeptide repeat protein n=1 Tax=Fibrisoma limi BUZ 3 TaxID=1185876 RepID=I2GJS4_9BACT|nr:hypothetical protein [Fibrisoma limi]CCH54149.1 hypothetical protein BN8_03293 [Fibrisoma limi BUZ 3]